MAQPPNDLSLALAHHLNAYKEAHGLSLRALARLLGMSPSYVTRVLEADANVSLGTVVTVSEAIGVPSLELLRMPDHKDESG